MLANSTDNHHSRSSTSFSILTRWMPSLVKKNLRWVQLKWKRMIPLVALGHLQFLCHGLGHCIAVCYLGRPIIMGFIPLSSIICVHYLYWSVRFRPPRHEDCCAGIIIIETGYECMSTPSFGALFFIRLGGLYVILLLVDWMRFFFFF